MRYYGEVVNGEVENDTIVISNDNGSVVAVVDQIWEEDEHEWANIALNAMQDLGYEADIQHLLHDMRFPVRRFF